MFSWRTRANCYFCFNQRKYEWVGLLEHEPELFWNAEKLENSESKHYWNGVDYPLTKIVEQSASIKEKRIKSIVKILRSMQQQIIQFDKINKEQIINDIFSTTSCGLFCGK